MEGESGFSPNTIDELHSSDIQGDQMADEKGVTRSIIDEFLSLDIEGDQMEGDSSVTPSIIDELIFGISKEIERNVKVVLLGVSLMIFLLRISNEGK